MTAVSTTSQTSHELPFIPGHWLTGSAAEMRAAPHRFPARIGHQHGGMARFRILNRSYVVCTSVEAVRHVLVHHHERYPRSYHHRNGSIVIGNSLLSTEGEEWLVRRRQILPAFKSESLHQLSALAVEETNAMLDGWEEIRRAGAPVVAMQQAQTLTLSVISRALFSARVEPADVLLFGKAVRDSLRLVRARNVSPVVPPQWIPTKAIRRLKAVRETLDEFVGRHLRAREAMPEDQWPDDILTMLKRVRDLETGEALSYDALRDETKTLFVAGFETTAGSLTWCLYLLARHPEVAARWHAEVDKVLHGSTPGPETVSQLTYAAAVIHEALRLYPPVYNLGRVALEDDEIAGKKVRRGEIMLISIFGAHHDPEQWEAPEEFRPERFLPGQNWNRLAFMPFAAGKHQCIGNTFAHIEIMIALALIGQRYEVSLPEGFEVGESAFITLTPDRDILLQLKPR